MDRTGCPDGYASDRIFESTIEPCKTKMSVYCGVCGGLIGFRVLVTALQIRVGVHTFRKYRQSNDRPKDRYCGGVPLSTFLELLHTIYMILFYLLVGLGFDTSKGKGYAAYSILLLLFSLSFMLSCLKLVHLGNKVLPKRIRTQENERLKNIRNDPLLSMLFAGMIGFEFLSVIVWIVPGLMAYEEDYTSSWDEIGLILVGTAVLCGNFIILRQNDRIVKEIDTIAKKSKDLVQDQGNNSLLRVMKYIRIRSIGIFIGGMPPVIIMYVAASARFKFTWYDSVAIVWGAAVAAFLSTMMYVPRGMKWLPREYCCCFVIFSENSKNSSKKRTIDDYVENKAANNIENNMKEGVAELKPFPKPASVHISAGNGAKSGQVLDSQLSQV